MPSEVSDHDIVSEPVLHRPFRVYGWVEVVAGTVVAGSALAQGMAWGYVVVSVVCALFGVGLLVIDRCLHSGT